ncbi:MAG: four helix bundle protein [Nitrospirae bacterium]|nr:four helix bundle protein [Nitrospirota bacterium]
MVKKVERFEDLIAWQRARLLTQTVYTMTRERTFAKDIGLSSQVQRAAVSIMANIAEGFERNRPGEFHQFLSVAKGSCAEVRSHLYAALDAGYLEQDRFAELLAQAEEVGRIIGGLRVSVAGQKRQLRDSNDSASSTQHSAQSTQH